MKTRACRVGLSYSAVFQVCMSGEVWNDDVASGVNNSQMSTFEIMAEIIWVAKSNGTN